MYKLCMNREVLDCLSSTSTTLFNNLSLQRKIDQHGCSFYSPVYLARFSNSMQKFQLEKNVCMNNWKLRNEQTQQLKNVLFKNRYSSKQLFYRVSSFKTAVLQSIKLIDDQNLWKILVELILVKLQAYSLEF